MKKSRFAELVAGAVEVRHAGSRAVDEHSPHVAVPALADPEQGRLPASRVFARHHIRPQPRREVERSAELLSVADRGQERVAASGPIRR